MCVRPTRNLAFGMSDGVWVYEKTSIEVLKSKVLVVKKGGVRGWK